MERALESARSSVSGPLRVGAMEVFSVFLLPIALCRMAERHPEVVPSSFEMLPQEMERRLLTGEIDVAFTLGDNEARGIAHTTLGTSPGVVVCGRTHPLYRRGRITKAGLLRHPSVVPLFRGSEHLPPIDQFPEERYPRRVGATIELLQMGIRMTLAGSYLGYFPEVSVRQQLDDGSLRALKGLALGPPFELRALTRKQIPPKAATAALIEQMRDLVRG